MEDITGNKYGRWTVLGFSYRKAKNYYWNVLCECGQKRVVTRGCLTMGNSKSCGCLTKEVAKKTHTKHGGSYSKVYEVWESMKARCYNTNALEYKNYGGRGIKVHSDWINSFENFYKDMGDPPKGKTIDRIDNDKGYSKENCRWATYAEQNRNRRGNVNLKFNGEIMCVTDWAERLNITTTTIKKHLDAGYTLAETFVMVTHHKAKYPILRGTTQGKA